MEWKRLVQFALQGSSDLEQYAILLIRVSIGLFFAISGANKLFVAGGTKPVYETLVTASVVRHVSAVSSAGSASRQYSLNSLSVRARPIDQRLTIGLRSHRILSTMFEVRCFVTRDELNHTPPQP